MTDKGKQREEKPGTRARLRRREFGRDEREARETQRRATAYGRARGIS